MAVRAKDREAVAAPAVVVVVAIVVVVDVSSGSQPAWKAPGHLPSSLRLKR